MVCCIAADLITNPTLTLQVSVVCLFRQINFWWAYFGVHFVRLVFIVTCTIYRIHLFAH